MGVPALFRWLSKKYPKIILPVVEEEEVKIPDEDGKMVTLPIDISRPNPNGQEFDNLYLDMNAIVHPCTHPEGKPAPETEEDMMAEVFSYTERVVSMVRPRKLLLMAVDGVAPRAKMNQQRSRRFRSAQEAKDKDEARKESIALWESMGQTISEEDRNKTTWDTNAITPGTPFMDLLATSLRYWVVRKMNTDPAWRNLEVIISDASVPGEGEHKIMDFIRRQRVNPGHDPNTSHIMYGLDADLIMLSLATHEPHFRVLREDVFFQDTSPTACRICGQEGHYAAQCTGKKKEKADEHDSKNKPIEKKPFIFLDVAILREYLEVELNVPQAPFPFNIEQAIDDWVLLIFFVGNDFLPHLPSLEIREGAIDTLLKIWKDELPRMGGYLTNHGELVYSRVEIILEGLAKREDEIFRRRRDAEERQDQNAKRRKLEAENSNSLNGIPMVAVTPSPALQLTASPTAPSVVHSLPPRPSFNQFEATADAMGLRAPSTTAESVAASAVKGASGSNHDWVANRRAIRMANMSAAEMLKAEMGLIPVKAPNPKISPPPTSIPPIASPNVSVDTTMTELVSKTTTTATTTPATSSFDDDMIPGLMSAEVSMSQQSAMTESSVVTPTSIQNGDSTAGTLFDNEVVVNDGSKIDVDGDLALHGVKRKLEDVENEDVDVDADADADGVTDDEEEEEAAAADTSVAAVLKVNPDGTVDQEDTVKLWEPGYKERYYRQKFGIELSDTEFRKKLTTSYVEGLTWVLRYYYQGTPSWEWFYPYHFAPFAADFIEVSKMDIRFDTGQPFKPFEQLMSVFPPASGKHIPEPFRTLMVKEDSPILDFYPEVFEIDMNGKKMAWQGVALLPFIDQKRLLDALAPEYPKLSDEEVRRNKWGSNVLYVFEEHSLFPAMESLYTKRKRTDPVPMDPKLSKGMNGSLLADPQCIPGSTYYSPFTAQDMPDINDDRSISALYYFPKQLRPHRSVLLPGVRQAPRILSSEDCEIIRRGGRGRGRGDRGGGRGGYDNRRGSSYGGSSYRDDSRPFDRGGRDRGGWDRPPQPASHLPPRPFGGSSHYSSGPPGSNGYGRGGANGNSSYYGGQSGNSGHSASSYGSAGGYGGYGGNGTSGYGGYGGTSGPYGQNTPSYGGSSYAGRPAAPSYGSGPPPRGRGRGRY